MTDHPSLFEAATPLAAFEKHGGKAEQSRGGNGVHVKFGNGWTVSIQWGPGTYSGNHDNWDFRRDAPAPSSVTAEIACWHDLPGQRHDHMALWADGDTVQGWRSWDQVQELLAAAAADSLAEPIRLWADGPDGEAA